MKRRKITEEFMLDNGKHHNHQYTTLQQYYIVESIMNTESGATLRLHCKPET